MLENRESLGFGLALTPLSVAYSAVIRCRNAWYDRMESASTRVDLPVISVGNLTVGGTGKTPLVIEIVGLLQSLGRRPAILTRGYGATNGERPDEVQEFDHAIPDVPVLIDADRVRAALGAQRRDDIDCLVLDDGFQHRRLRRDVNIVLIDALRPWGRGWTLPAGRLREPIDGLRRADCCIITRSNQAEPDAVTAIEEQIRRVSPGVDIVRADVTVASLEGAKGAIDLDDFAYETALPVCGIGNPQTFSHSLSTLAGHIAPAITFSDHHNYTAYDVDTILKAARAHDAGVVVTTRKDWVKLGPLWQTVAIESELPLLRLDVRAMIVDPSDLLRGRIERALARYAGVATQ